MRSCRFWHVYSKRLRSVADPLFRLAEALKRPLLPDGVVQNSPNLEIFVHNSAAKPNYHKPQKTGWLFSRKFEFETLVWTCNLPKFKNRGVR